MFASEREVADVLDKLHVEWEYEPRLFELKHNAKGHILEGFRPDFYLPKYNLYIEVTKGKQKHVTDKHRKARLVQELYEDVRIGFVYKAHFEDLTTRVKELLGQP